MSILNTSPKGTLALSLQELWINPLTNMPLDHGAWWTIFSPTHTPMSLSDKHQTVLYISKSLASADISSLPHSTKFIIAVDLRLPSQSTLRLVNMYNPPTSRQGIQDLATFLLHQNNRCIPTIITTDANLHHSSWNPPGYHHVHQDANQLLKTCGTHGFCLRIDPHQPTFISARGAATIIDLVWCNFLSQKKITAVHTTSDNHGSNHQRILITLDLAYRPPPPRVVPPSPATLDTQLFLRHLAESIPPNITSNSSTTDLEKFESDLTAAVKEAWFRQGRKITPNPTRTKKWWDPQILNPLVKCRNSSQRLFLLTKRQEDLERFTHWNGVFKRKVAELKQDHWRRFLANTDSTTV